MPSVTVRKINKFYNKELGTADPQRIRSFLTDIAETLKDADRSKIQPEFISELEVLINKLRNKIFSRSEKYSKEVELLYAEIKGLAQSLGQSSEQGELDRTFYKGIYELGMLLEELAAWVKVFAPIVMAYYDASPN